MLLTYRAEIFVHIEQSEPVKAETENFVHKSLFEIAFVQVLGGWAVLKERLPRLPGQWCCFLCDSFSFIQTGIKNRLEYRCILNRAFVYVYISKIFY